MSAAFLAAAAGLSDWALAGACERVFPVSPRPDGREMFSQMGLEIWIKWTSNYLDAQSLDDTLLRRSGQWGSAATAAPNTDKAGAAAKGCWGSSTAPY